MSSANFTIRELGCLALQSCVSRVNRSSALNREVSQSWELCRKSRHYGCSQTVVYLLESLGPICSGWSSVKVCLVSGLGSLNIGVPALPVSEDCVDHRTDGILCGLIFPISILETAALLHSTMLHQTASLLTACLHGSPVVWLQTRKHCVRSSTMLRRLCPPSPEDLDNSFCLKTVHRTF